MTDDAQTPETPPEGAAAGSEPQDRQDRKDQARRERLRAAESRVSELEAKLQARDRRDAEMAASAVLADPGDLFAFGTELDELRNDAGELDPALVREAADRLVASKPHLARRQRVTDAANLAPTGTGPQATPGWADVLRRNRK